MLIYFQTHLQNVQHRIKKIEQLNRQAATKAAKKDFLEQQLPDMQVTVAERKHVHEAIGNATPTLIKDNAKGACSD